MNKKLLNQLWNERRSNLALWLELLLISVALWFVVDTMYVRLRVYFQPRGMDITHTYKVTMARLSENNPAYQPDRRNKEWEDVKTLLERISQRPDIEAAATSSYSLPYRGDWNASHFLLTPEDSVGQWIREDWVSAGFRKVFRLQGLHGETPEEMDEIFHLPPPHVILNGEIYREEGILNANLEGVYRQYNQGGLTKKVGEIRPLRRNDYCDEWESSSVIISNPSYSTDTRGELSLRVKEDQDVGFADRFWADAFRDYRIGNVYIQNIESMEDVRREFHKYDESQNKIYYGVMSFMLFNVFIALFGVFWFRTRQRRREIALHMALGASRGQVFTRLISEGFFILFMATLPALAIDYGLIHAEMVEMYKKEFFNPLRFVSTTGITFLLIGLTIVCSIAYPAYKATRIPPAEALNEGE